MNFANGVRPPHPGDEDLLRHIDHQLDLEEGRRVRAHLLHCGECSARAERMMEESGAVSSALRELEVRPDPRRAEALAAVRAAEARARQARRFTRPRGMGFLRAAAIVLVVVSASMFAPPVRAWVGDRVEKMVGPNPGAVGAILLDWLGTGEERVAAAPEPQLIVTAPPAVPVTEAVRAGGSGEGRAVMGPSRAPAPVTFTPEGNEVVVDFASVQAAGSVSFTTADVPAATARLSGAPGGETMTAVPGGLEVRNTAASRASYEVAVPSRVRLVRVRVAGEPDRLIPISPSKRDWVWTVGLQPEPR